MSVEHAQVQRTDFDQVMVPNYAPAGFIPVRGEGSRVWDQSGRELVDFTGGIAVNVLGHAHPALVSALTEKGVALGTALAFMMAVTGLSLPEFLILRRVMKLKLLVIFASVVGIGIILTGYLFNFILR